MARVSRKEDGSFFSPLFLFPLLSLSAEARARARNETRLSLRVRQAPALGRVADRVSLGLTPTSRPGWPLACAVLKDCGGTLHVHENARLPSVLI